MCGRFTTQYTWAEYHNALSLIPTSAKGRNDPPRYNVAPTQQVGFVCIDGDTSVVKDGRWGLVPFWAKAPLKMALINARSETASEKPSFREAFKSRRCLIPASGYFEWTKGEDGGKDPHYIYLPEQEPYFFAGLWAQNDNLDITSCTILTSAADPAIKDLHDRMPVILKQQAWKDWISKDTDTAGANALLNEHRGGELVSHRVDRAVNSSKANGSQLIEPV